MHFSRAELLRKIFHVQKLNRVCYCQMSSPTGYFCRTEHFIIQIAARNCRKRKSEQITQLEEELDGVRQTKQTALDNLILAKHAQDQWRSKLQFLESRILQVLTEGKSQNFRLVVAENNSVKIVNK